MLDAYTVKKMLPRLVIAIILVNLSWSLCNALIEISNQLGEGLNGLLANAFNSPRNDGSVNPILNDAIENIGGSDVIVGGAVIGLMVWQLWPLFLPGLLMALAALLVGYLVVIIRQVLLIVLVILSPVAIAFWVIPGTEQWAKRWWGLFIKLILMYPLIVLFLDSGYALAAVLNRMPDDNAFTKFLALIATFIPYFMIAFTAKFVGGFMTSVAGMVNRADKGLIDKSRNWGEKRKARGGRAMANLAKEQDKDERAQSKGRRRLLNSQRWRARNPEAASKLEAQEQEYDVRGVAAQQKADQTAVAAEKLRLTQAANGSNNAYGRPMERSEKLNYLQEAATDETATEEQRRAAIGMLAEQKATEQLEAVQNAALRSDTLRSSWNKGMEENYSTIKSASPHMATEVRIGDTADSINRRRGEALDNTSDEALAGMHQSGWAAYQRINSGTAQNRFNTVMGNEKLRNLISRDTDALFGHGVGGHPNRSSVDSAPRSPQTQPDNQPDSPPVQPRNSPDSPPMEQRDSGLWVPSDRE